MSRVSWAIITAVSLVAALCVFDLLSTGDYRALATVAALLLPFATAMALRDRAPWSRWIALRTGFGSMCGAVGAVFSFDDLLAADSWTEWVFGVVVIPVLGLVGAFTFFQLVRADVREWFNA